MKRWDQESITVVLRFTGDSQGLHRCLKSVCGQDYPRIRLFVIGGPDEWTLKQLVREYDGTGIEQCTALPASDPDADIQRIFGQTSDRYGMLLSDADALYDTHTLSYCMQQAALYPDACILGNLSWDDGAGRVVESGLSPEDAALLRSGDQTEIRRALLTRGLGSGLPIAAPVRLLSIALQTAAGSFEMRVMLECLERGVRLIFAEKPLVRRPVWRKTDDASERIAFIRREGIKRVSGKDAKEAESTVKSFMKEEYLRNLQREPSMKKKLRLAAKHPWLVLSQTGKGRELSELLLAAGCMLLLLLCAERIENISGSAAGRAAELLTAAAAVLCFLPAGAGKLSQIRSIMQTHFPNRNRKSV